ncbi:hypothetical protein YTPLAS72_14100 [Nitrospira sp.]|nr:hypothetical protein YTPLAS72_14100 [Nitrospira sp.]
MSRQKIHISNVTVRLPSRAGRLMSNPRKFASDVGQEIVKHVAAATRGHSGVIRIDRLSSRTISMSGNPGVIPTQVGKQVASNVMHVFDGGER